MHRRLFQRMCAVKYRSLPETALTVSQIALGTAGFGSAVGREEAFLMLDAFVAGGGTLIDTAHVYADWLGGERSLSEKTIGAWLRDRRPEGLVIATKGGHPLPGSMVPRLSSDEIVADLDGSLRNLGLERIDLYYLHRDDPARPVEGIMEVLHRQVRLGKLGAIACSNWQIERIAAAQNHARAAGLTRFAANQPYWSLAIPNPGAFAADHALTDDAALEFHIAQNLPLIAYTAQARGFFAKAAVAGIDALKPELRKAFANPVNAGRLERAKALAAELGLPVSAIVLAWMTSHPARGIPVIGPKSMAQLADSLAHADLTLGATHMGFLTGAVDPGGQVKANDPPAG